MLLKLPSVKIVNCQSKVTLIPTDILIILSEWKNSIPLMIKLLQQIFTFRGVFFSFFRKIHSEYLRIKKKRKIKRIAGSTKKLVKKEFFLLKILFCEVVENWICFKCNVDKKIYFCLIFKIYKLLCLSFLNNQGIPCNLNNSHEKSNVSYLINYYLLISSEQIFLLTMTWLNNSIISSQEYHDRITLKQ